MSTTEPTEESVRSEVGAWLKANRDTTAKFIKVTQKAFAECAKAPEPCVKALVEAKGGEVVGLAVVIYQPYPEAKTFDPLPFYYLAKLDANYYPNSAACELCKKGEPAVTVNV